MNQIIYTEDNYDENKIDNKKTKKDLKFLPMFHILIILIVASTIFLIMINNNSKAIAAIPKNNDINNRVVNAPQKNEIAVKENIVITNNNTNILQNKIVENQEAVNTTINQEIPNKIQVFEYKASNGKTYDAIAKLNIPSLGIKYPVLLETSEELLKVALNKYWGPNPNEVGNLVIVGHNYKSGRMFGKLKAIKIGAIVEITDVEGKTLKYKVYDKQIIDPYDNSCTSQLTNGNTEITLITCQNHGTQRLVVKARAI